MVLKVKVFRLTLTAAEVFPSAFHQAECVLLASKWAAYENVWTPH